MGQFYSFDIAMIILIISKNTRDICTCFLEAGYTVLSHAPYTDLLIIYLVLEFYKSLKTAAGVKYVTFMGYV